MKLCSVAKLKSITDFHYSDCKYGMPYPPGVNIASVFEGHNDARVDDLRDYANMSKNKTVNHLGAECGARAWNAGEAL